MKKTLTLLAILIATTLFAQQTYVPDDNFEQALIDLGYDTVLDDYVPTNVVSYIQILDIPNKGIYDLTGIEDFVNLAYLSLWGNHITSIDLRNSVVLQELYLAGNPITVLDLSHNVLLTRLSVLNCQLKYLNVQNGNNINSVEFNAHNNPDLTCIQVDDAAYSTANWTGNDPIASFSTDCGQTFVPGDNFEQALITLGLDSGALDDIVTTSNINGITNLNVSNKNITDFTGIEDFIALTSLNCGSNNLTELALTTNTNLTTLTCSNNQLTSLDISQLSSLNYLDCNFNQLTNIDVSQNTQLTVLACRANQLTNIDVSNNNLLQYFSCRDNLLIDLDVSNNPDLVRLWCFNNQLTSLNVKNGANTNISNSNFNATNNPGLDCIQIDDLAWNTTNWTNIDSQSYYSEDCNATYVPDDNFEQALIDLGFDTVLDNYVTTANINTITFLNISNKNISDLTGLEDFTMLQYLNCDNNLLTNIDIIINLLHLTDLFCINNQLTSLDVSNNSNLDNLRCENNLLTSLNVSQNTALQNLNCKDNQITSLDLSLNTSMYSLNCQNNQLTELNFKNGNNAAITTSTGFRVNGNPNLFCIEVDDVAYSTSSWYFGYDAQMYFSEDCNSTYVPDDNFEQALIDLGYDTVLNNYVLTTNINTVTSLDVSNKSIADLTGIEGFTALTNLQCNSNQLSSLDISQNTALTNLTCNSNPLGSLDVSQNTALTNLNCQNAQLTSIDVTQNTSLTNLNCKQNQLTALDVSQNTALTVLDCRSNQIDALNLFSNTNLTSINCSSNQIVALDITNSPSITFFSTSNNSLESLDLANGNNTILTGFFATGNPNLNCINVDNVTWSTANWTNIDTQSYFATDCNITYVPDDNFEQALIDLGYDSGALDNYVPTANISGVTNLDISNKNIADLTGIEDFAALYQLVCNNNQLTSINLTQNTALTWLNCSFNMLNSIDVSQNTALTSFICSVNQLTNLDISQNTALTSFTCGDNQLTNLDVSNNINLTYLSCGENQLTTLDISQNIALEIVGCNANQLTSLILGNNTALSELYCEDNQLTNLNLTQNTGLTKLYCKNNLLTNLDLSNNTNLLLLYCENNQLTNINIGNNSVLTNYIASGNQLGSIDITPNSAITYFWVENNNLTNLILKNGNNTNMAIRIWGNPNLICIEVDDVAWSNSQTNWTLAIDAIASFSDDCGNITTTYVPDDNFEQALIDLGYDNILDDYVATNSINSITNLSVSNKNITDLTGIEDFVALTVLHCANNQLSSLNLTQNTVLEELNCNYNQITALNLSQNTSLAILRAHDNQINNIDLSANTALTELSIGKNLLSSIDLSTNLNLTVLGISYNLFTAIDVSLNNLLEVVHCHFNSFSSLDFSANTSLIALYCNNNPPLTDLDMRNGNNTNITDNAIMTHGNPNLTCINVDDAAWSTANWTTYVDVHSSYSENCTLSVNQFNLENAFNIYPNPVKEQFTIQNDAGYVIDAISIYTILGKLIYKSKDIQNTIDVSTLSNGMYLIKLNSNNKIITKKIIINK